MSHMSTYKLHRKKNWTNAAITNAIAELKKRRASERAISKKYNIPRATLQRHLKEKLDEVGQKSVFTEDEEADLKDCIKGAYLCILATYFNLNITCH